MHETNGQPGDNTETAGIAPDPPENKEESILEQMEEGGDGDDREEREERQPLIYAAGQTSGIAYEMQDFGQIRTQTFPEDRFARPQAAQGRRP